MLMLAGAAGDLETGVQVVQPVALRATHGTACRPQVPPAAGNRGRVTVKVEPTPGWLVTVMSPPII
jgi:hypothetical protein